MKTKQNVWSDKKKTILLCIVIVMILVLAVSFVSFFKADIIDEEEEQAPYDSMYNASRYFFRVFYPDDWDVSADPYGFLMNEEGLVLELFPLKKISASSSPATTASPTPASGTPTASATVDPRAGMERNPELTMSFYYKEYDALYEYIETLLPASPEAQTAPPTPAATPSAEAAGSPASGSPEQKEPPMDLEIIADYVFEEFQKAHEPEGYGYSAKKGYNAETIEFVVLPYSYIQDGVTMSGELYVAARAMAYYVIQVEGTEASFRQYSSAVQNILYHMVFSVFEY